MAIDRTNIKAETATIYISAAGTSLPTYNDSTGTVAFSDSTDWVAYDAIAGDIKIEYKVEYQDSFVQGYLAAIKRIPIKEECNVEFTILETDLATLGAALGVASDTVAAGASQVAQDTFSLGDNDILELSLAIYGKSPEGYYRIWYLPLVCVDGSTTLELGKEAKGVTFNIVGLADTTQAEGERMLQVFDMTGLKSS